MKSLRSLISWSAFVLMAGLLLFSALVYAASEVLLQRFVDGRLLVLAGTLAEFVERQPELFSHASKDSAPTSELTQSPTEQHVLPDVTHALRVFFSRRLACVEKPSRSRAGIASAAYTRTGPPQDPPLRDPEGARWDTGASPVSLPRR
ncbi:MAG: hypothetical protein HC801_08940 [Nitrospira sp.]|nr:hypothetical protein [Nitrospira sp.]